MQEEDVPKMERRRDEVSPCRVCRRFFMTAVVVRAEVYEVGIPLGRKSEEDEERENRLDCNCSGEGVQEGASV